MLWVLGRLRDRSGRFRMEIGVVLVLRRRLALLGLVRLAVGSAVCEVWVDVLSLFASLLLCEVPRWCISLLVIVRYG